MLPLIEKRSDHIISRQEKSSMKKDRATVKVAQSQATHALLKSRPSIPDACETINSQPKVAIKGDIRLRVTEQYAAGFVPRCIPFLPQTLPHTLSREVPGKEEQHEDAEQHPSSPFDQQLQAVNFSGEKIAEEAEGCVPYECSHQFIAQKAPVLHPGHSGTQGHKRTEMPDQVRHKNGLSSMFFEQHTCHTQPSSQAYAAAQLP